MTVRQLKHNGFQLLETIQCYRHQNADIERCHVTARWLHFQCLWHELAAQLMHLITRSPCYCSRQFATSSASRAWVSILDIDLHQPHTLAPALIYGQFEQTHRSVTAVNHRCAGHVAWGLWRKRQHAAGIECRSPQLTCTNQG